VGTLFPLPFSRFHFARVFFLPPFFGFPRLRAPWAQGPFSFPPGFLFRDFSPSSRVPPRQLLFSVLIYQAVCFTVASGTSHPSFQSADFAFFVTFCRIGRLLWFDRFFARVHFIFHTPTFFFLRPSRAYPPVFPNGPGFFLPFSCLAPAPERRFPPSSFFPSRALILRPLSLLFSWVTETFPLDQARRIYTYPFWCVTSIYVTLSSFVVTCSTPFWFPPAKSFKLFFFAFFFCFRGRCSS